MGILDLFKKLIQGKNAAEASMLQDIRRKEQADRARKRREKEIDSILKLRKKQAEISLIRTMNAKIKFEPVKPRVSALSLQDILGLDLEPKRRRRK